MGRAKQTPPTPTSAEPAAYVETAGVVGAGQPRLPLSCFRSTVAVPAGWELTPSGYLAFGDRGGRRCPLVGVARAPARRRRLHLLHDPEATVAALLDLTAALGLPARSS